MAKSARNPEVILTVKDKILNAAQDIIIAEGYSNFSMRKLAASLGMTAANIYNYFSNKDEIYILIQARGFERLYQIINRIYKAKHDPLERLEGIIRAYIDFGVKNPDKYEIMFSSQTPRYMDYIGTDMEKAAEEEKQIAMKVVELGFLAVKDIASYLDDSEVMYNMIKIWIMLNGIVNLYNSHGLREIESQVDILIERIIEDIINSYRQ
jgi:AcrR family transcriptional regulator